MEKKIMIKSEQNYMSNKHTVLMAGVSFVFLFGVFFALPNIARAASLYFSPSSGSHTVGSAFSVSVYVSSADQAMNAASGIVSFPQDKLEVVSLSKSGSIFSLWTQEPLFSNGAGTVKFEGIALNPGFKSTAGKIITINFKTKAAGVALLSFSSGSALANDGKGTNVLANLVNAQFNLDDLASTIPEIIKRKTVSETISETVSTPISKVPAMPQIISSTHPDSNKWYSDKNPRFSWTLPTDVNGVSIYLSPSSTSDPGPLSDGLLTSKSYENISDGIWYFHIKMRNFAGWGPIAHFKIQIDTRPPEPFEIKVIDSNETENPRPTVIFDTVDYLSGISYYKIKIGDGEFFSVDPEIVVKSNPLTLPFQNAGKRSMLVQAFDNADNYSVATEDFLIKSLQAPVFTNYPKEIETGKILKVSGESKYPNSKITIWLQMEKDNPKNFTAKSDKNGKFVFSTNALSKDGTYQLWAEVTDTRGAKSPITKKITIIASRPAIFSIGTWTVSFLYVVVPLIALIAALFSVILYGWHKFSLLRKQFQKEVRAPGKIKSYKAIEKKRFR